MKKTVLNVSNLGKTYGDTVILKDVSLTVESGESIAFMSPSGSGKSTMLSMLGLLLTPSEGTITINGQDASALRDSERSRLRLEQYGFIFQHTQLVGSLRAIENVTTPANFLKGAHDKRIQQGFDPKARAEELLARLGLEDRLYHFPYQLSIGQKRRVAMARALLLDPPILIADEPTNDLDAESTQSVADMLFRHVGEGGILLFATHDPALASRADRVMRLIDKTFC